MYLSIIFFASMIEYPRFVTIPNFFEVILLVVKILIILYTIESKKSNTYI
mgnify:CR=1 FL=1